MRLKSLELKAFGPFTEQTLEFDSLTPGLHIIFGPNEAGKSSSLRGLEALLFGFPTRTPDNFLHSYDQLLVGGSLVNQDGREFSFQRRKRRVNDLLDMAGNPVDKSTLAAFLQGMEPAIFESLYGIDHRRLEEGGAEILSQEGEIGRVLFTAGSGLTTLRQVIEQLDQEAADLFKSTGQLPEINKAIKRFKSLKAEFREAVLPSKNWKDLQSRLQTLEAERTALETARESKDKELHRLERLQQAIPELASLKVWQERLGTLGKVKSLPADFERRHRQLDQDIHEAQKQLHRDSQKLKQKQEKFEAISLDELLLEHGDLVNIFHERLGEYRKGQRDRPERNGMRISLRQEASLLLKQIRPDIALEEVESLRPTLVMKKNIQSLSSRFEAINEQVRQADKRTKTASLEIEEVKRKHDTMAKPQDTQKLEQAVKQALRAGDLDGQLATTRSEVELARKEGGSELKRIGHWSGELSALLELTLPLAETVHQFELRFSELDEQIRGLERERQKAEKQLQAVKGEIKRLEYGGEIPSEEELQLVRGQREEGWQLLRRQWLDGEDVAEESRAFDQENDLPTAYEGLVEKTDVIADRLCQEADRVASIAVLRAQLENLQEALVDYDRAKEELTSSEEDLKATWAVIWKPAGITPLTPQEMGGWLAVIDKLRYRIAELLKKEKESIRLAKQRSHIKGQLIESLEALGEKVPTGSELEPVLLFAENVVERIEHQRAELRKLEDQHHKAQQDFARATEDATEAQVALADWREQWQQALSALGMKMEIPASVAIEYIETLEACLEKVKEAADLQKRIDGIDRDADQLDKEVKNLLRQIDDAKLSFPVDQAISYLREKLGRAQEDKSRYDQLKEDIEVLQGEMSASQMSLQDMDVTMTELLEIGDCKKPDELSAAIERFREYSTLGENIADAEDRLAKIGGGTTVEELIAQAAGIDGDELPGRIERLRQEIEARLNPAIINISQEIGEVSSLLKNMNGGTEAADARGKMELELARIRRLSERYFRVKLASQILQQEVERYREEHQDPIMKIASRYFAGLTLNSFNGLREDVDDKGEPVIVGIRPNGSLTRVGGMSDGTRDQLYLALRLATLEYRLESTEPMPFIVDDILVNFDDQRSKAALEALADLSEMNQVILFTHHQHIAEQARNLDSASEVTIHHLQV